MKDSITKSNDVNSSNEKNMNSNDVNSKNMKTDNIKGKNIKAKNKAFIKSTNNKAIMKISVLIFWIFIWQAAYLSIGNELYMPAPLDVLNRLMELLKEESFWRSVLYSVFRVFSGVALSVFFGVLLGIISGISDSAYELLNPAVVVIKSTPVMSFIIIALIWFSSSVSAIFICFLMCFPIIWTATVEGIRNVDKKLLEMAKVYRVKTKKVITGIYSPSLRPYFTAAITTAVGLGWKVTVAAEVLSSPKNSIGENLFSAKAYLDSVSLFSWTVVVIILSFLFEGVFVSFMKKRTGIASKEAGDEH